LPAFLWPASYIEIGFAMFRRSSSRVRALGWISGAFTVAAILLGCNTLTGLSDFEIVADEPDGAVHPPTPPIGGPEGGPPVGTDASSDDADIPPPPPDAKRVFVTSGYWYAKQVGGPDGADALCRQAAKAGGLGDVAWRAWISTSSQNAKDRIVHHGKYVLVNATHDVVVNNFDELVSGTLENAISITEKGTTCAATLDQSPAWTGTNPDGTLVTATPADNCADYLDNGVPASTGIVGSCIRKTAEWTNTTPQSCSLYPARLYCFEL
jgi:hypothetical protein